MAGRCRHRACPARKLAANADQIHRKLAPAATTARDLVKPPPQALTQAGEVGIDATTALTAWQAWAQPPDDTTTSLADDLSTVGTYRDDVPIVRAEAGQQLAAMEDLWRPIAQAGMVWLEHARADRADVVASGWGYTSDYHDWSVGLPRDAQGAYYLGLPCQQDDRSDAAAYLRSVEGVSTGAGNRRLFSK